MPHLHAHTKVNIQRSEAKEERHQMRDERTTATEKRRERVEWKGMRCDIAHTTEQVRDAGTQHLH